jgi:hypothetical protein
MGERHSQAASSPVRRRYRNHARAKTAQKATVPLTTGVVAPPIHTVSPSRLT